MDDIGQVPASPSRRNAAGGKPVQRRELIDMQRRTPWRVVSLLPAPTCLHDRYPSVNPALLAVGYDNEVGDRYMSYSAADRLRFIEWLRAKYGTIEALNRVDLLQ